MLLRVLAAAAEADPVRSAVLGFLASYGGIAFLVVAAVGGLKGIAREWTKGKEPLLGILFTFILGAAAKAILPAVYGPPSLESWLLHLVLLFFVAVGAKGIHDGVVNALRKPEKETP